MDFSSLFIKSAEGNARMLKVRGKRGADSNSTGTIRYLISDLHLELTIDPSDEENE